MRRETKGDLIRGFLAINAMLREEAKALRRQIEARVEEKYNPNWLLQPRAPRGAADGGQWVDGGGGRGGGRFLQQRADRMYPIEAARYERGEFGGLNRENAIGNRLDEILRLDLRSFYASVGLREDELVRVNRNEYLSRRQFRRPDARVADIFFDISLEDKRVGSSQIEAFFSSEARPTYVIIIRPRQIGRTFLITPRPSRYRRNSP